MTVHLPDVAKRLVRTYWCGPSRKAEKVEAIPLSDIPDLLAAHVEKNWPDPAIAAVWNCPEHGLIEPRRFESEWLPEGDVFDPGPRCPVLLNDENGCGEPLMSFARIAPTDLAKERERWEAELLSDEVLAQMAEIFIWAINTGPGHEDATPEKAIEQILKPLRTRLDEMKDGDGRCAPAGPASQEGPTPPLPPNQGWGEDFA